MDAINFESPPKRPVWNLGVFHSSASIEGVDSESGDEPPDLPPIDIYYSSHPHIELRPCENKLKGRGLFATKKILEGEVIWKHQVDPYGRKTGRIYTNAEVERIWKNDLDWFFHWAYRCGEDAFLGPITKESVDLEATYFQNHSCDPSTWWVDEITLSALRDIEPGDEITFDYATSEFDEEEIAIEKCLCGSSICRGSLRGDDYLRPDLIERYGGHFQPYLLARIRKRTLTAESSDPVTLPERDL